MLASDLIQQFLAEKRVMQIATASDGQPWICTVYFVVGEAHGLYWLSLPTRRHSQDIAANPQVAVAIVVKADQPIIGIQASGNVSIVTDQATVKSVMENYVSLHGKGQDFYASFVAGTAEHRLYECRPSSYVLFDEVHFADQPQHEWTLPDTIEV